MGVSNDGTTLEIVAESIVFSCWQKVKPKCSAGSITPVSFLCGGRVTGSSDLEAGVGQIRFTVEKVVDIY